MPGSHDDAVREQFRIQAATFTDEGFAARGLDWIDGQFDLVVCRIALHQVGDPAAVVREMVRVTRPAAGSGTGWRRPHRAAPAPRAGRHDPAHPHLGDDYRHT